MLSTLDKMVKVRTTTLSATDGWPRFPPLPSGCITLLMTPTLPQAIGACERLVQTPVPLNYARHTSRFLSIWCLTLPFALVGDLGFSVVPVLAFVAWGLFGIQEIGLMIEEPFRRSLRLDIITRTIYADVQETTYVPEWAKRSPLDRAEADEAKRAAEARLLAAASGKAGGDAGGGGGGGGASGGSTSGSSTSGTATAPSSEPPPPTGDSNTAAFRFVGGGILGQAPQAETYAGAAAYARAANWADNEGGSSFDGMFRFIGGGARYHPDSTGPADSAAAVVAATAAEPRAGGGESPPVATATTMLARLAAAGVRKFMVRSQRSVAPTLPAVAAAAAGVGKEGVVAGSAAGGGLSKP